MNDKTYKHDGVNIIPEYANYSNGRKALIFKERNGETYFKERSGEIYIVASVNIPDEPCPDDEMYIKDYSENKGIADWLIENGFIEKGCTGMVESGYVNIKRYKISKKHLNNWDNEDQDNE